MRMVHRLTLPPVIVGSLLGVCLAPACIAPDRSAGALPSDAQDSDTSGCPVDPCVGVVIDPCFVGRANYPTCTTCEAVPAAADTPCDDGDRCTIEDRCQAGQCLAQPVDPAVGCDDQNACTEDSCDPEGGCVHATAPLDDTPCDDGNDCTGDEVCQSGQCLWRQQYGCPLCNGALPNASAACESSHGDGDRCNGVVACDASLCLTDSATIPACDAPSDPCSPSACDPSSGNCVEVPRLDGASCSDLSSCTRDDACVGGICVGAPVGEPRCACDDDDACGWLDDGDLCNGRMRCRDHVCVFDFASPVVCPAAAAACKVAACDPADGQCHDVNVANGTTCDDANRCTREDHCDAGLCIGAALDCTDLDSECAVGACDPVLGCQRAPRDPAPSVCETGVACQLGTCEGTACVDHGQGCDDGDACTADSCDRIGAKCVSVGPTKPTCAASGACAGGVPVACVDGDHYVCDYAAVPGFQRVDECQADSNCDAIQDAHCVPPNVDGCPPESVVQAAWEEGAMLACAHEGTAVALECQPGWHACTYSELSEVAGLVGPPRGYYIAASISFRQGEGYSIADTNGMCVPWGGHCQLDTTVQAMTWDHLYKDTIVYAAEAWTCEGVAPEVQCDAGRFEGVMCCANRCQSHLECDDHNLCTLDGCDTARGRCTHESLGLAGPPCPTAGVCVAAALSCNANGRYECALEAVAGYEPIEAACDGLDNDCNGKTDAFDPGFAPDAPLCERQEGVCLGTKKPHALCSDGRWISCGPAEYQAVATYEANGETRCDGLDNDCDGRIDDGFLYVGAKIGAACTGIGACGEGTVVCAPDAKSAACSSNPNGNASVAKPEACNGLDDDCDGETDDADDLAASAADCLQAGVCAAGVPAACAGDTGWICDYAAVEGYQANERCDGLDNDCDGQTDEGFGLVESGVTRALGDVCGTSGCAGARVVCTSDGAGAICSSDLGPDTELCDGVDNDCDDSTDEDIAYQDGDTLRYLGDACPARGVCGSGTVECGPSHVALCSTHLGGSDSQASAERCNRLDDDCDGLTDEGFLYLGTAAGGACDGRGECGPGTVVCADETRATCSTNPGGGATSQAVPETCNGKDDDCDGQTDDGVTPGASGCTFVGVCTPQSVTATCTGGHWDCDFSANPDYQADNEIGRCDGRDNDCDGHIDEDFPSLGAACDGTDADNCARGRNVCATGGAAVMCVDDVLQVEACGGGDEDCDGETDEAGANGCSTYYLDADEDAWGVATTTFCLCASVPIPPKRAAQAGDCDDALPSRNPGAPETCNAIDDDCDGATDAQDATDLLVDDPRQCEVGGGNGVCQGATKPASLCVGGAWQGCTAATYSAWNASYQTTESSCDGKDNDCDTTTDARDTDLASVRPGCAVQKGVCAGAVTPVTACTANGWAACDAAAYAAHSPAFQTVETTCDAKDNDCDGTTDEGFDWLGQAPGANCMGYGVCGAGRVECTSGGAGATCSSQPDASAPGPSGPETCNGLDDDCDNATDDGLSIADSPCRRVGVCNASNVQATCSGAQGWVCNYSQVANFESGAETRCDERDNDCDGQTDEDMVVASGAGQGLHKGAACGTQGACGGTVVCAPNETLVCSTTLSGGAEICDSVDNDCDGQTDEGFLWNGVPIGGACDGTGECGVGVVECDGVQAARCSTNPGASHPGGVAETCDGRDNDCDGATDEGFAWRGLALGAGCDGVGVCGAGTVICAVDHTHGTCSTNPDAPGVGVAAESCNGLDDDCDDQTDEGLGVADSNCTLTGVCDASNVAATCNGQSGWSCNYTKVPNYHAGDEVNYCDGLDNDCDGETDEDYPELGHPCDGADADLCQNGVWRCATLDVTPVFGVPEAAQPVIEEPTGVPTCEGDAQIDEVCDAHDNDCDGQTDENGATNCQTYFRDGDLDTWGLLADSQCRCAPGNFYTSQRLQNDCDDAVFSTNPGAIEACDGADNDCDGATDEVGASGCVDYYYDWDRDSFGVDGDTQCLCDEDDGTATFYTAEVDGDCDDTSKAVSPAATETCNGGIDDDCDGVIDPVGADGCTTYYTDADVDTFGVSPSQCRCLSSSPYTSITSNDCCDSNANAFPNQTAYFTAATGCGNFDYDCSGASELRWSRQGACRCSATTDSFCVTGTCELVEGWATNQPPACGATGAFVNYCARGAVGCASKTEPRTQECR